MSTFGFPQFESRRGPGHFGPMPGAPPAVSSGWRALPVMQRQPNYAAAQWQQSLQQQREAQGRELKRQDELRRIQQRGGAWRGRPAPQVTNIYYTQPAPITQVQPAVVTAPATSMTVVPPSMPAPQPDISPGASTADMGPTQDAAAASADSTLPPASASPGDPNEHPVHKYGRRIIIGLVIAGAAFGGYKLYQRHKHGKHGGHAPHHGMQGFRRRRRR